MTTPCRPGTKRAATHLIIPPIAWLLLVMVCLLPAGTRASDTGDFHWKSVDGAEVKLDDKVPLTWNVYQTDKRKSSNLVLVLLGRRYILLDVKARLAYLVFPDEIHAQGDDFNSGDLALSTHVIPSNDWTERDIGPAEEYRLTLEDYGRTLSVQLPHPLDIRLGVY
jgi:hypothetical protein